MNNSYPSNKFIIWTLAPLHRNATGIANAARAREFVNWVNEVWLSEDSKSHPNIYIFDFFSYAAELSETPENGVVNCLKYEYEGDHNGNDSHPNEAANTAIMPIFGQFIADVLNDSGTGENEFRIIEKSEIKLYPNPAGSRVKILGLSTIESIEILDIYGKSIQKRFQTANEIDVSMLPNGIYIFRARSKDQFIKRLLIID